MNRRLVAWLVFVAMVVGACVIAEPPTDLPPTPQRRPFILRSQAVPAPTGVLTRWPDRFLVPVELVDSRQSVSASAFVDYNPITGEGWQIPPGQVDTVATPGVRVRPIEMDIPPPTGLGCRTIEIVVASQFLPNPDGNGRIAHTPSTANDGDTITWFYSPNGDPSGCVAVDAGLVPATDAGDGGDAAEGGSL